MSLEPDLFTVTKDLTHQNPARGGKPSVKDTMAAYEKLDEAKTHPNLIILKPSGESAPDKPTQMKVFRMQAGAEVEDEAYQKLWNACDDVFSALQPSDQAMWLFPSIHFIQDYFFTPYDDRTHCIVECLETLVRYSLQSYRGISTWYVTRYATRNSTADQPSSESKPSFHPFYRNKLIPGNHKTFASLEALANFTWKGQHQNCSAGHFRVNIHLTADHLTDTGAKFATHRVCGDALVADLFRVIQRCSNPLKDPLEPNDQQTFKQVLWDEGLQYGISGEEKVQLGYPYNYQTLKQERTAFKDTEWFKDREYVWLLPCKTTRSNRMGSENC